MRYEDLCLKMDKTVDSLLDFLDLSWHKLIDRFISQNTHENQTTWKINSFLWNTKRNSSAMAFEWRKHMNIDEISKVQQFCSKPMKILGYNPIPMTNI